MGENMKILNSQTFATEMEKTKLPVVLDIYAEWCGPCKAMSPVLEEIEKEYDGKLVIFKLNVDESQDIAQNFNVMSIPTLVFFNKEHDIVNQTTGFSGKESIMRNIYEITKS
jgi:thioredoxin 1